MEELELRQNLCENVEPRVLFHSQCVTSTSQACILTFNWDIRVASTTDI
jgi:hypothetical protein